MNLNNNCSFGKNCPIRLDRNDASHKIVSGLNIDSIFRYIKYLFILVFSFCFNQLVFSQCGTIILTTQAEVDNFSTNYPNCSIIMQALVISGPDITNLNGLSSITAVGGSSNSSSNGYHLSIIDNPVLVDISGLTNCNSIVNLFISNNPLLANIQIFGEPNIQIHGTLSINQNNSLTSLPSFNNYNPTIPESELWILGNPNITYLTGFNNVNLSSIVLIIFQNQNLTSINGFNSITSSIAVDISLNPSLESIIGFNTPWSIQQSSYNGFVGLRIDNNISLNNISFLNNFIPFQFSSYFGITNNVNLSNCSLTSICQQSYNISINNNKCGCNDVSQIQQICNGASYCDICALQPQYSNLENFYNSTNGQNWINTTTNNNPWLVNCDPCGLEPGNDPWFGLTCNAVGQVTDINLPNNNLSGTLPTSLSGLTALESLKLRNNNVSGTINNNLLNGLSSFEYLDLGENDFGGLVGFPPVSIPLPSFPSSVPIKYLYLDNNNFLNTIPTIYGTYSNLLVLNLSDNTLVGNVPDNLGLLPNLYNLSLNHNELSGLIPSTFGNLTPHIGVLRLQENNLSGCFDDNLHSLCNIPTILQSHINTGNSFDMEWDDFCDLNATNCQNPDVPVLLSLYNSTTGANWTNNSGWQEGAAGTNCDPCGLICGNDRWHGITCNLNGQVIKIELGSNNLTGTLLNNIQNITTLTTLDLNSNNLSGVLPSDLGIENIDVLNLSFNNFTGTIPSNYYTFEYLALSNNQLTGSIPNSFATSTTLDYIFLNDNDLCGCYDPSLIALCTSTNNASNLNISNGNNFNAPWDAFCAGTGIGQCGSTQLDCYHPDFDALESFYNALDGDNWNNNSFWLSNCDPCGACPGNTKWHGITCINNRVTSIVLPNNNLTGSLPVDLTELTELRALVVNSSSTTSPNNISGELPSSYGDFEDLITLNVSGNDLTGSIPPSYCGLENTLNLINLSNNALSGCYDQVLSCLCNVNVVNISTGNNFPIPFSTFCATGDGTCTDNCLDLDGTNDYLQSVGLSTSGNFSVMAWFKADIASNGGAEDRIISFGGTQRLEIGFNQNGNLWLFDHYIGIYSTNIFVRDGNWHHVTFTRTGNARNIYLDGALVATYSASTGIYGPNFRVGNWSGGGSTAFFSGQVDEIALWNYALSASDILNLTCDITGAEAGLIAFYNFNLGVSGADNTYLSMIPDQTTNGNDLNIFNMALNGVASNLLISSAGINSDCASCFVLPTSGEIQGAQTICSGLDPIELTNTTAGTVSGGATLSYRWESSISPFSTWNTIVGATGINYDPPSGLTETTYYRRVTIGTLNTTSCESSPTNVVMVTVQVTPTSGAISGEQTICSGADPGQINNTAVGGVSGGATLSYRWERSESPFSSWNTIVGANGLNYDPPSGLLETTHYRRVTIGTLNATSCESSPTNVVIVTIVSAPPIANCNTGFTSTIVASVGFVTITTAQINNGSTSACNSNLTFSFHPINSETTLTYNCSQTGQKNVTLYVTDANGLQSSCNSTFEIEYADSSLIALREIYESTGGVNWANTMANDKPWFEDCDPCGLNDGTEWFGIDCKFNTTLDNIVIDKLFLQNNNLDSVLPDVFDVFEEITWLNLFGNPNLNGNIPPSFCEMTSLQIIQIGNTGIGLDTYGNELPEPTIPTGCFLDFNQLSILGTAHNTAGHFKGTLPEFSPLAPITNLYFDHNLYSGNIPESYCFLNFGPGTTFRLNNNPNLTGCYEPCFYRYCTGFPNFTNAEISTNTGLPSWSNFCSGTACCVPSLTIDWTPIFSGTYKSSGNIQIIHPNPVIQPNANLIFSHGPSSNISIPSSITVPANSNIMIQPNGCN